MEMETSLTVADEGGRQVLKELSENIVPSPTAKLGTKKSQHLDTVGGGLPGNGGGCGSVGDQIKSEKVTDAGDIKTDKDTSSSQQIQLNKSIDTLKTNREITSSNDNYNATVLPDIINVQPNLKSFTEASADDSLISSLASNLGGLQIATPKGQKNLAVPQNSINYDGHSGVSSDDEVFSECQTFNEASTMDGEINQSNHWNNVVSSVTSGCNESLENTLEQIEPFAIEALALQEGQTRLADSTITSTEQITCMNSNLNSSDNEAMAHITCNLKPTQELISDSVIDTASSDAIVVQDMNTSDKRSTINSTSNEIPEINIENVSLCYNNVIKSEDLNRSIKAEEVKTGLSTTVNEELVSTSVEPNGTIIVSNETSIPERQIENQNVGYNTAASSEFLDGSFNREVSRKSTPNKTVISQLDSTFALPPAEPLDTTVNLFDKNALNDSAINPNNQTGKDTHTAKEKIENASISYNNATPSECLNGTFNSDEVPIKSTLSSTVKFDSTFALSPIEPLNTTANLSDKNTSNDSTFSDNKAILNSTFATSCNIVSDCITKNKEEKCVENELRAAALERTESEPMDIDVDLEEPTNQLNSTVQLINMNTPKNTSAKLQNKFVEDFVTDKLDVTFKMPSMAPSSIYNKRRSNERMEPTDADFMSNGLILNPADFDFLLSKGNSNVEVERNSILLRFDPLLGHPVPVNQQHQQLLLDNIFQANKVTTVAPSHLKERLGPTLEESQPGQELLDLHDQFTADTNSNDTSKVSLNSTVSNSRHSTSTNSICSLENVSVSEINDLTTHSNFQENQKLLKDRINQNQPEEKKGNVKMSADVIQDMKIENDGKSLANNINSQTDEKQDYKMAELEKKIKNEVLKTEDVDKKLKDAEQREEALLKRITEKDKSISKMSGVLEAYEKAIAELIAEKEQIIQNYAKQMTEIKSDRDLNYQHLTSLEATFSDLHAKYERSKQITATLKASEEDLLAEKRKNVDNLRLQEQRYEKMKNHAMQQLEIANNKLDSLAKTHSSEITKLKALLKKEEISRLSLTEQLQQKTRENEELVKICDELINGQGS